MPLIKYLIRYLIEYLIKYLIEYRYILKRSSSYLLSRYLSNLVLVMLLPK